MRYLDSEWHSHAYTIALPTVSTEWQIVGAADFLGNGQAGLVWENTLTGERGIWILHNGIYSYTIALPTIPTQWHIAGAADFLGTGQGGLVWENTITGARGIWILHGGVYAYSIYLPTIPVQWQAQPTSSSQGRPVSRGKIPSPASAQSGS